MGRRKQVAFMTLVTVLGCALWTTVALAVIGRNKAAGSNAGFDAGQGIPFAAATTPGGMPFVFIHSKPMLLYVFSPTCGWCKQNQENIVALHAELGDQYQFVAVALMREDAPVEYQSAMASYLRDFPFPGEVVFVDPMALAPQALRDIRPTPQLLVVKPGGEIWRAWVGALIAKRKADAERFFQVSLPGIPGEQ